MKSSLRCWEACVDRLEKACTFDGNVLTISENDTFLSVIQAVETGVTLMRYGAAVGNQTYIFQIAESKIFHMIFFLS